MNEVRVTMRHIRAAGMCSAGTREFFKRHNLDWADFLKNGIPAEKFLQTKDAMAIQVVRVAENAK